MKIRDDSSTFAPHMRGKQAFRAAIHHGGAILCRFLRGCDVATAVAGMDATRSSEEILEILEYIEIQRARMGF